MSVLDKLRLTGKVAIMTGAGRGLGRVMALALAEAGADIVAAARTQAQIDETAEMIRARNRRCLTVSTFACSSAPAVRQTILLGASPARSPAATA